MWLFRAEPSREAFEVATELLVRRERFRTASPSKLTFFDYEYDGRGNWVKWYTRVGEQKFGETQRRVVAVTFREITYYGKGGGSASPKGRGRRGTIP
jgi:hypothetical protein